MCQGFFENKKQIDIMGREITKIGGEQIAVLSVPELKKRKFTWRELIGSFVSSQSVFDSSRALYARTLTQYFKWVDEKDIDINQATLLDIQEYIRSLESKHLATRTIISYIVVVRKFYEWAESNLIYPNIAKGVKTPKRKRGFMKQHLSDTKSKELLAYFKERSLRNYAIVSLMLRTGLRTAEVARANIGDISFATRGDVTQRIIGIWGKGRHEDSRKSEFEVLTDVAYQPIADYLATRPKARPGEPLFVSESHQNFGERLSTKTISSICKEGLKVIGLDGHEYTAHSLRHTTAVAILTHGGNITDVQDVLRHSSIDTSRIYLESIKETIRFEHPIEYVLDNAF